MESQVKELHLSVLTRAEVSEDGEPAQKRPKKLKPKYQKSKLLVSKKPKKELLSDGIQA